MTNRRVRLLAAPLALTLSLVLSACGSDDDSDTTADPPAAGSSDSGSASGSSDAPAASDVVEVTIENFAFSPAELTVPVGTTIRITNLDGAEHDWDAEDGTFKTDLLGKDESTEVTLDKAGTFPVFCSVHPQMKGTVTVQ